MLVSHSTETPETELKKQSCKVLLWPSSMPLFTVSRATLSEPPLSNTEVICSGKVVFLTYKVILLGLGGAALHHFLLT